MLCPRDQTPLLRRHRNGVEIDHCPTCRGVWLDRGELDKIISATLTGDGETERYNRQRDSRANFVGELFDF